MDFSNWLNIVFFFNFFFNNSQSPATLDYQGSASSWCVYRIHLADSADWEVFCWKMDFGSMNREQITLVGSGFTAMMSIHYTVQLLSQHIFYWKNPKEQKAILIIIFMAPVYAINAFVGLLDYRGSKPFFMFLDSIKECYEALVI